MTDLLDTRQSQNTNQVDEVKSFSGNWKLLPSEVRYDGFDHKDSQNSLELLEPIV